MPFCRHHDVKRCFAAAICVAFILTGGCPWASPKAQVVQHWQLHCPSADWPMFTCRAGINGVLINWFAASAGKPALQQQVARLMELTGAYSISGLLHWLGRLQSQIERPCRFRHHHHAATDLPTRQAIALQLLRHQVLAALSFPMLHMLHHHAAPACCAFNAAGSGLCCTSVLQARGCAAMQARSKFSLGLHGTARHAACRQGSALHLHAAQARSKDRCSASPRWPPAAHAVHHGAP